MADYALARVNMVESQIRPNQVTDPRIIAAMLEIPREAFVPASIRPLAYMDEAVLVRPAGRNDPARRLLAPMVLARLIQAAQAGPADLALDVGCATGYSTAILARLCEAVVGLENEPELAETASKTLVELEVDNAAVVTGPLAQGYAEEGPYDVIVLNGAVPEAPHALLAQLKEGGRLVTVLSGGRMGRAHLYERVGEDCPGRPLFDAGAPELPGFEREPAFVF